MLIGEAILKYRNVLQELPSVVRASHVETHNRCHSEFRDVARRALVAATGQYGDAYHKLIDEWLNTFHDRLVALASRFVLDRIIDESGSDLGDLTVTATDVEAWVLAGATGNPEDNTEGKVFDARDVDVDSTIRRMQGILVYESNPSGSQQAAQEKYLPFIRAFLANQGRGANWVREFGPEIVLASWVAHVRATWPVIAQSKLRQLVT